MWSPTTASTIKTTHVGGARGLVAELNMLSAYSGARLGQLQGLVITLAQIGLAAAVRAGMREWYGGGSRVHQRACREGLGMNQTPCGQCRGSVGFA